MTDRGQEFADLAYTVIVTEKRFPLKRVALDMGFGYDALHARIVNRTPFSAEEIRRLIRAAPDPRFAAWLLRGTRFVAAERAEADEGPRDPDVEAIHLAATRIVLEAADVLEAVEVALSDQRLDHRDALEIRAEIEVAERALASLGETLRRLHPGLGEAD
jgi:hypothetical protein